MRNYIICVCCIAVLGLTVNVLAAEQQSSAKKTSNAINELQNIIAINLCVYSIYNIEYSKDRIVIDNEYNELADNINFENIDNHLKEIIEKYIDALNKFTLSKDEQNQLDKLKETVLYVINTEEGVSSVKNIAAGVGSIALAGIATIATSGAAAPALKMTVAENMPSMTANLASLYAVLQGMPVSMNEDSIDEINKFNEILSNLYRQEGISDSWRITRKQFNTLNNTSKEPDHEKRHRAFVRLEKDCGHIPVYWYYRAQAAHAAAEDNSAQKATYAKDIKKCIESYGRFKGILKRDRLYASILMFDIINNEYSKDIILERLQHVIENDPHDGVKRLFAAQICMEHGLFDEAIEHLYFNLDAKKLEVLSRKLMADAFAAANDTPKLQRLVERTIADDSASNQEVLYQLGKLPDDHEMLKTFVSEVFAIRLTVDKSMVGNDGLLLTLPQKWILSSEDNIKSTLSLAEKTHAPQKISTDKDGASVSLYFEKVLELKAALNMSDGQAVGIDLVTEHYLPLQLSGRLIPMDKIEEATWLSSLTGSAKESMSATLKSSSDYLEEKARSLGLNVWNKSDANQEQIDKQSSPSKELVFVPDEIRTTGTCFRLDAGQKLTPCVRP